MITKIITKKKIKENLKFEQISNVMQLSRDWGEVGTFRFQDSRLTKGDHVVIPFIHLYLYFTF